MKESDSGKCDEFDLQEISGDQLVPRIPVKSLDTFEVAMEVSER